ncbi:hypothetical protein [Paenibacillus uliginis]|uniref:hypothetical protein n=1 Tax=Paenibacillus uliginis TaxID=683737 RepID=UPI001AD84DBF|nr:hypothetical protein [Paenibacillus uliginis]
MIREIEEQFTEEILTEAIKRYNINNELRHALLYIYFHQANDVSKLDEESMNRLKEIQRVAASDDPILPIDFVQEFKSIYNSIH